MATKSTKHKQTKSNWNFFEAEFFPFKKKQLLIRFEARTFAVPGVLVNSRLSVPVTLENLSSLRTKIPSDSNESFIKVVNPKKIIFRFDIAC